MVKISPSDSDLALLSKLLSIADEIFQQIHLHRDDKRLFLIRLVPSKFMRFCQRADSNWTPLSVVMAEGIPFREIQPLRNACAVVLAVLSRNGMASGHRVKQSTHVSKYRQP